MALSDCVGGRFPMSSEAVPDPEACGEGPAAGSAEAIAALAQAIQDAGAKLEELDPQLQARRWARQRSLRLESSAETLRVLLSALGFPTRDGTSEFSTFDPEKLDPQTTRGVRRAVKAILADLEAAAKSPWSELEPRTTETPGRSSTV